jgi:hypothetical protein
MKTNLNRWIFSALSFLGLGLAAASAFALEGEYHGNFNGTPSKLDITRDKQRIEGTVDIGGYLYQFSGRLSSENQGQGTFSDPQTGGSFPMQIQEASGQVQLQLQIPGNPMILQFGSAAASGTSGTANPSGTPQQQETVERDPALVGSWLYTESYSSGGFSGASQVSMVIYPDGRYEYGNSAFAGGGAGIGGSSRGGDIEVGEWKTQNRVVYTRQPGVGQWEPYARYYVEGGSMLFTFGDGSKQVWKRSY